MMRFFLIIFDALLINAGFLLSFLIRYGFFPERNFTPYKNSFIFLTFIYILSLFVFGSYKSRFKSSWDLFKRNFSGLIFGTLLSVTFVYVFREKWGAFPTTIFIISFIVNLLLIFKFNQIILKLLGKVKKNILVLGEGKDINDVIIGKADIQKIERTDIENLCQYKDVDEIIIYDLPNEKDMSLIAFLAQKLKADVFLGAGCYIKLLREKINGNDHNLKHLLATFISRKRDSEEAVMRCLDIVGSIVILFFSFPVIVIAAILIKLTSKGPVFYTQERIGKDGEIFTVYKLRTMVNDAEKELGPVLAAENDPRVTKVGRFLRDTRIDEFPQVINVLLGQMSLVGPRPERPFFIKRHEALMEMRLTVRPGLTGLAQVRNAYDLHPKHKIKYDYLYIQRRSVLLNLYIITRTLPVMLFKRGQ